MVFPKSSKAYTYADYLKWEKDVYAEVINGEIISMLPSLSPKHQDVVGELTAEFKMFLRDKECMVFPAPMDVCLFAEKDSRAEDILDWVQPDLIVVCDQNKIGEKYITGAPDLVIEVLSPSTVRNDRWIKLSNYEKAGVKEYWIVDPYNMSVEIFQLEKNKLIQSRVLGKDDLLSVERFSGFQIDLKNI